MRRHGLRDRERGARLREIGRGSDRIDSRRRSRSTTGFASTRSACAVCADSSTAMWPPVWPRSCATCVTAVSRSPSARANRRDVVRIHRRRERLQQRQDVDAVRGGQRRAGDRRDLRRRGIRVDRAGDRVAGVSAGRRDRTVASSEFVPASRYSPFGSRVFAVATALSNSESDLGADRGARRWRSGYRSSPRRRARALARSRPDSVDERTVARDRAVVADRDRLRRCRR